MITGPGAKPVCSLCASLEHEHIRSGESCTDRLVKQRNLAQTLALIAGALLVGVMLAYASVVVLYLR